MKYKSGDLVIKTTGGNKMSVFGISDGIYKCIWCVGDKINESLFKEDEIITLNEYKTLEEREYKINQILKIK
jgi:uncharacterized protein YodC (DUF2158 family)